MITIKQFLSKWGMHSFLLPVFFILHNYLQYYGLVSGAVALETLAALTGIILLFFLLTRAFIKNTDRCLQLTTLIFFVLLFYGVLKDFISLTLHLTFFTKYTLLLPVLALVVLAGWRIILKKKNFSGINLFQNVLLLIFIFADAVPVLLTQNRFFLKQNLLVKKNILAVRDIGLPAEKPDIYFLLFDAYPGTRFLQDYLQFNNSRFDSMLEKKGFRVLGNPKSNYNRTAFSLTSELNFEYLQGLSADTKLQPAYYDRALLTIRNAVVPDVFNRLGYNIYNLSIFEFAGRQPVYKENFLTSPERYVLLYNTLPVRLKNDVSWRIYMNKQAGRFLNLNKTPGSPGLFQADIKKREYNNTMIDSLLKITAAPNDHPRFVYAHFYLPHPPYFYTDSGAPNNPDIILDKKSYFNKKLFFSYLGYTNRIVAGIVDTLLKHARNPPVIIIQSDHSSTDYEGCPDIHSLCFKNYAAFYFPDRNYTSLYDSLSNINTFPVIFNKYFNTHIPMQKDSSIYLSY